MVIEVFRRPARPTGVHVVAAFMNFDDANSYATRHADSLRLLRRPTTAVHGANDNSGGTSSSNQIRVHFPDGTTGSEQGYQNLTTIRVTRMVIDANSPEPLFQQVMSRIPMRNRRPRTGEEQTARDEEVD